MTYRIKKCWRCKRELPVTDFHKNKRRPDGVSTACKPCAIEERKAWCAKNREQVISRDRYYYRANSTAAKAREQARREAKPIRQLAQIAVKLALYHGRLHESPCAICGADAEAHHASYDMPLDVTWLCRRHHRQLHAEARHYVSQ